MRGSASAIYTLVAGALAERPDRDGETCGIHGATAATDAQPAICVKPAIRVGLNPKTKPKALNQNGYRSQPMGNNLAMQLHPALFIAEGSAND